MEFEVLNEKIEWECRRMAAAFGVKEWQVDESPNQRRGVGEAGLVVVWGIDFETARFIGVQINGPGRKVSSIYDEGWIDPGITVQPFWNCSFSTATASFMARGLYCLGIEDEAVLAELNHPLTAHEKLELRLSMPREFWPQKWQGEANGT